MTDSAPGAPAEDLASLSYEAALAELDALIQKLEGGSIALEDAIAAYERGTRLARHCEALLDRTERRVNVLVIGGDGRVKEAPLEVSPPPAPEPEAGLFAPPRARRAEPVVDPDDVPF